MADEAALSSKPAREAKVKTPRTPDDKNHAKALGKALWRSEIEKNTKAEDKKASWTEGRRKYLSRAGKLLKMMQREGLQITMAPPAAK